MSVVYDVEMANFEFDQSDQQFIVQTLNNSNGEARLPTATSQSLPSVTQAVGPLPSVGVALNQVAQAALNSVSQAGINHQDALSAETTVAQQLSNISECDSSLNRGRSTSPKFIQLTNMATITNSGQPNLSIKQESTSPPVNQQLNQVPLQQYAFVPSHNHFVSQQLSPTNVSTSVSPLTTNTNQILPQQQIIHNLAAQICPQVPQQHQQTQQQHLVQQQHQQVPQQLLHQMQQSQPILQQIQAQQLTPQHQQLQQQQSQQLQQQQFQQQFQGQMQEYNQHQLVQIMNNNNTALQRQNSLGQTLQDPMSQNFLQQPLNMGDNHKTSKSRKRSHNDTDDGDTSDTMDDSHSAMPIKKRPHQVPEDLKDDAYWEKRKKNNDSARRSREARRVKEEQVAMRVVYLENENLQLRTEVTILKTEIEKLRGMLYE